MAAPPPSISVKFLKEELAKRGVSTKNIIEKEELQRLLAAYPPPPSRMCRLCHDTEATFGADPTLVSPCLCTGSMKWIHRSCLDEWRVSVQNARGRPVHELPFYSCAVCKTRYKIQLLRPDDAANEDVKRYAVAGGMALVFLLVMALVGSLLCRTEIGRKHLEDALYYVSPSEDTFRASWKFFLGAPKNSSILRELAVCATTGTIVFLLLMGLVWVYRLATGREVPGRGLTGFVLFGFGGYMILMMVLLFLFVSGVYFCGVLVSRHVLHHDDSRTRNPFTIERAQRERVVDYQ